MNDNLYCRLALCEKIKCPRHPKNMRKDIPVEVTSLEGTEYCIKLNEEEE